MAILKVSKSYRVQLHVAYSTQRHYRQVLDHLLAAVPAHAYSVQVVRLRLFVAVEDAILLANVG